MPVTHLRRAVELDPAAPRARLYYALYLHRLDMLDDAMTQLSIARELDPLSLAINALHGSFLSELGDTEAAIGSLHALDERDDAFRHLDEAATPRDIFLTVYGILSNRHLTGPFRSDPRFQRLRVQVGLAP